MKRLLPILFILLTALIPSAGRTWGVVGLSSGSGGGGDCLTDSEDSYKHEDITGESAAGANARGQSFQVSKAGKLSAIEVYFNHGGTNCDITMRWGTSNNLGSYTAEATGTVTEDGWVKFTFGTKGDISAETTYFWGLIITSGANLTIRSDNIDPAYAYGTYYYADSGWNMGTTIGRDLAFRVYLCD